MAAEILAVLALAVAPAHVNRPWCHTLYTAYGTERTADRIYAGIRSVLPRESKQLARRERCLINETRRASVRAYDRKRRVQHQKRVAAAQRAARKLSAATSSWYYDGGATASGFHAYYGIANKYLAFGTRVLICFPYGSSRCVLTTVDDRGPYVGGRDFDLNQNVAGALGFSGVQTIGYRIE